MSIKRQRDIDAPGPELSCWTHAPASLAPSAWGLPSSGACTLACSRRLAARRALSAGIEGSRAGCGGRCAEEYQMPLHQAHSLFSHQHISDIQAERQPWYTGIKRSQAGCGGRWAEDVPAPQEEDQLPPHRAQAAEPQHLPLPLRAAIRGAHPGAASRPARLHLRQGEQCDVPAHASASCKMSSTAALLRQHLHRWAWGRGADQVVHLDGAAC